MISLALAISSSVIQPLALLLSMCSSLNQEDIMDGKKTVREVLKEADPELQIVAFKRFTLRAE